jgi:hypothetical protein
MAVDRLWALLSTGNIIKESDNFFLPSFFKNIQKVFEESKKNDINKDATIENNL